ncbi:MAG: Rrf2 family transcriptional regulator [Pseudomonadota bacterium]
MKLSTKGRYAVTAMADMALQEAEGGAAAAASQSARGPNGVLTSLAQISERQDISLAYLEQLFSRLRRAGLVKSARGPGGGYRLARAPSEIRISEIMSAVDETLNAMKCGEGIGDGCGGDRAACLTHDLWEQLSAQVYLFLHGVSLADVVSNRLTPCNAAPNFLRLLEEEGVEIGERPQAAPGAGPAPRP